MRSTNKGLVMTLDFLQVPTLDDGALATLPAHLVEGEVEARRGPRAAERTDAARALVAVVGLGYAGLSSAMALRRAGLRIVAIETSASRLADIRCGRVGMPAGQREQLRDYCRDDAFVLTDSIEAASAADTVLICVPAALDRQRRPQPEALRRACAAVVQHARAGQTLVLMSTTYVGSTRELLVEPLAERGLCVGEDVFVAFCPERAQAGAPDGSVAPEGSVAPDGPRGQSQLVVGGVTETCFRRASELLCEIGPGLLRVSSPETAEMVRLYESTFAAVNVALAFELADACRSQGIQPLEVAEAAAARPFGLGSGFGGAGVPPYRVGADPHQLLHPLRERGCAATLAEEAMRRVDGRPRRLAMRAYELLTRSAKQARDARVLVVGACSEPATAERREEPAVEIIERLRATGAHVDFHDPLVPVLVLDGEDVYSVDPDPRRDASGFGPEDYDLAVLVAIRDGHDYGWLSRCPQVLDCTYRERTGRRYFLP
jgi:UDP-N-acetyl-D-glucosamine dehydrogenase